MLNGIPRILIVRLSAIGDVVRVLPALHALRRSFPNAQIDWVVERKAADIVDGHPALDRTLVFERSGSALWSSMQFLKLCAQIKQGHYDIVMDFHGILKSGLLSFASRAPERFGFAAPRGQELSWLAANRRSHLPTRVMNRVEENLFLVDALAPHEQLADCQIFVPEDIQDEVDAYFERTFDGGKRVVAIHVPIDRKEKQWPAEHFGALADLLLADGRFEVLLTWGPGQFDQVEAALRHCKRNPVVAPETGCLKHYAWIAHRADLYFGGDTGPMHIASAMGTPVVAVFGGTDPARHAPYRRPCEVLYIPPSPEMKDPVDCLSSIRPKTAFEACIRVLSRTW